MRSNTVQKPETTDHVAPPITPRSEIIRNPGNYGLHVRCIHGLRGRTVKKTTHVA